MSDSAPLPQPGWYDDGSGRQRWWSGAAWTEHFAPPAPPATPNVAQVVAYQQPAPTFVRPLKDTGIAYVFAILLAGFGAHHFYLGNVGAGIAYILLWWGGWALSWLGIGLLIIFGVFIWWIVDLCTLRGQVDAANRMILGSPAY
ncbi:NINE protein [Agromyces albus]|uniref:NINE protein n=1 Tax=Agromyces albus TaxID=205332 RepID=UPI0027841873|nr:NINE protein [Agromyces albus]MDQ0576722.1 TM2 domain-containing membrane protein YozV [Agromyces albus]